jgi:hypothetical protein
VEQLNIDFDLKTSFDWEQSALRQLEVEYLGVLRARHLEIKPAKVALMDSDRLWGEWNASTRTISLARTLVKRHAWFHVLGVLRHEMAHQCVSESPLFAEDATNVNEDRTPHGARFRRACRLIGVPDELTGASADLQSESPDWKQRRRDEAEDKLLDRVKKLLALATSSNEHEALLAMNKVRELYAKYNLDQVQRPDRPRFSHLVILLPKSRFEVHHRKIFGILAEHFFVKVLTFKQYDAQLGERRPAFELIGTSENVLMAEYVFHFLLLESDFLVRERAKQSESKLTPIIRKSYRLGILTGFEEKLTRSEYVAESTTSTRVAKYASAGSRELSVIGQAIQKFRADTELEDYLSTIHPKLGKSSAMRSWIDAEAYDAGKVMGRAITLNKAVTEAAQNRGRLLTHNQMT